MYQRMGMEKEKVKVKLGRIQWILSVCLLCGHNSGKYHLSSTDSGDRGAMEMLCMYVYSEVTPTALSGCFFQVSVQKTVG